MLDPQVAQSMEDFVSWPIFISSGVAGLVLTTFLLLGAAGNVRRRLSAGIDFVWTMASLASIVAAMLTFSDLVWQGYQRQFDAAFQRSFEQLSHVEGSALVAANCPGGKALPDADLELGTALTMADSACLAASRIAYLRKQIDARSADLGRLCPVADRSFVTRDYSTSKAGGLARSCSSTDLFRPCMQARCDHEHAVANVLFDVVPMGEKLRADAALAQYRHALAEINKISMHEIEKAKHPFDSGPFYACLPLWFMLGGARLARGVADFLDPNSDGKGLRKSCRRTCREWMTWGKFMFRKRRRELWDKYARARLAFNRMGQRKVQKEEASAGN